jgi:hypothetical protein
VAPSFSNTRSPVPPSHHRWPIFDAAAGKDDAAAGKDDARSDEPVTTETVYDEEQEDNEHVRRRMRLLESENSRLQETAERLTMERTERAPNDERNDCERHEVAVISVRARQLNAPGAPTGATAPSPSPHNPDQRRAVSAVPVGWRVMLATLATRGTRLDQVLETRSNISSFYSSASWRSGGWRSRRGVRFPRLQALAPLQEPC